MPSPTNLLTSRLLNRSFGHKFSTSTNLPKPLLCDFYFDTVSPYSWPAFEVLCRWGVRRSSRYQTVTDNCRYRARWQLEITWKPVYLAGLTQAAGNTSTRLSHDSSMFQGNPCKLPYVLERQYDEKLIAIILKICI